MIFLMMAFVTLLLAVNARYLGQGFKWCCAFTGSQVISKDNQLQDTVDKMAKLLHFAKLQGDTAVKISELNKQFDELFSGFW